MKRTIVKFGTVALLLGMVALLPACNEKPAEDTTATEEVAEVAAVEAEVAVAEEDTSGGKEIKTGSDPVKQ